MDHIGHGVKVTDSTKGIDERYGKEVGTAAWFLELVGKLTGNICNVYGY